MSEVDPIYGEYGEYGEIREIDGHTGSDLTRGFAGKGAPSTDLTLRPIDLTVVIPVYDEEGNLERCYREFREVLDGLHVRWEVIFVDDGSRDKSSLILEILARRDHRVKVIHHRRNYGRTAALTSGFAYARGMWVATADADLQQDASDLERLWKKAQEGHDFVNGTMVIRRDPLSKRLPSKLFNAVVGRFIHTKIRDLNSAMKLFRHELSGEFMKYGYGEFHRYFTALSILKGYRVAEIPIEGHPRISGRSKFGAERFMRGFLDFLTIYFFYGYMERPLHLFGGVGLGIAGAGWLGIGYLLWEKIAFGIEMGSRPLLTLSVLFVLFGLQLFVAGLLASMIRNLSGGSGEASRISSVVGIDRRRSVDWRGHSEPGVKWSGSDRSKRPGNGRA